MSFFSKISEKLKPKPNAQSSNASASTSTPEAPNSNSSASSSYASLSSDDRNESLRKQDQLALQSALDGLLGGQSPLQLFSGGYAKLKTAKHWNEQQRTETMSNLFEQLNTAMLRYFKRTAGQRFFACQLALVLGNMVEQDSAEWMPVEGTTTEEHSAAEVERFNYRPRGGPDLSGRLPQMFFLWAYATIRALAPLALGTESDTAVDAATAKEGLGFAERAMAAILGKCYAARKKILQATPANATQRQTTSDSSSSSSASAASSSSSSSSESNAPRDEAEQFFDIVCSISQPFRSLSVQLRWVSRFLHHMLSVLDDELLLVLHADEQWGAIVKIRGVSDNFQLEALIANALHPHQQDLKQSLPAGLQPLFKPWSAHPPHVFNTMIGEGPFQLPDESLEHKFTTWNYYGVERADKHADTGLPLFRCGKDGKTQAAEYRVWGEGVPLDIDCVDYEQILGANAAAKAAADSASSSASSAPWREAGFPRRVLVLSRLAFDSHTSNCMREFVLLKAACYYQRALEHAHVLTLLSAFADCGSEHRTAAERQNKVRTNVSQLDSVRFNLIQL